MDPEYKPRPLKTSEVELDPDLQASVEAIAQNIHEVWAQARQDGGWKQGPERNDERKEHPSMIPYAELSESEKEIDRGTVEQTLKTAVKLGFEIRRRGAAKSVSQDATKSEEVDDMGEWPPCPDGVDVDVLAELVKAREAIGRVYATANKWAWWNLQAHRIVAVGVGGFGTGAVCMAIWQLYKGSPSSETAEFVCAGIAIAAVFLGVVGGFRGRWLVQRHRAERCRFLKFNLLLEVASANKDRRSLLNSASRFQDQADNLGLLNFPRMEQWLEEDQILQRPPAVSESETALSDMKTLASQYLRTRLAVQSEYFLGQSSSDQWWDRKTGNLPAVLFLVSVCFAVAHFAIHKYGESAIDTKPLILVAAVLPALSAGIRSMKGVWEHARNTTRFKAKYNALTELIRELEKELSEKPTVGDLAVLLWKGEQILEGEHREWLRLMKESEWVG